MRIKAFLLSYCFCLGLYAQEAIHNYGALQLHDGTSVGFHLNLINDGDLNQDVGLVGFYGDSESLNVSGIKAPVFFDTEIAVDNGLLLDVPMYVANNTNFISGHIITPKNDTRFFLNFLDNAFYVGENDISMVDGYAAATNTDSFTFPVGDNDRLRTLRIESAATNALAKCAYFYEDPNTSQSLGKGFSTTQKTTSYISISQREFWKLESDMPSRVTLTWNAQSNINALGEFLSDLKVVGWSKTENQWVNLGNTQVEGSMASGSVTSEEFVPNDYEIITIGGNDDLTETFETIELDNYFLTPNGDGKNDFLVLEGIEKSPNNTLQIFDRYGVLVYSKTNYTNEFNGISNQGAILNKNAGLASGVYFYIITMNDLRQKHQGYMYVSSTKR
ncbi:gliding motility-associated C-terminal domain-containing protein [Ulvibacterium sp.]|uniref:gliding motility-associated C-terminal domain-containing protein n=1 Tax=Ulvibacterium sp. TaxID=2665914 RepID=UPI002627CA63|nr:gliding motility-associated C-terminal domain-containing protein [Ulvibacterium sp.]